MKSGAIVCLVLMLAACSTPKERELRMTVIDPGHFHASLLQKKSLEGVSDTVKVFAPAGRELDAYVSAVKGYNSREENPTRWVLDICSEDDWLERIPKADEGEFVVLAGNNGKKAEYIRKAVKLGYNVLSDKPMAIESKDYVLLSESYGEAQKKGIVTYDMMTERYEILNRIVRSLMEEKDIFGKMDGAYEVDDVHYFCKYVSGKPVTRPEWYFDVAQQGYGIADVTTHFIDLAFWECFPETRIERSDIRIIGADMYPTVISKAEYQTVTGAEDFPEYLSKDIRDGSLEVLSNGCLDFEVKGVEVKISMKWNFSPADGAADSFRQRVPGSRSVLEIIQDETTGYKRELYIRTKDESTALAAEKLLKEEYPFATLLKAGEGVYLVQVPDSERLPHEEHFNKVGEAFTSILLKKSSLNGWEMGNALTKYFVTTESVEIAKRKLKN